MPLEKNNLLSKNLRGLKYRGSCATNAHHERHIPLKRVLARGREKKINDEIVSRFQKMYFYRCIVLSVGAPVAR